ncbi:hypothetical protein PNEG_00136 [Pneumocystis murina B123]|uniref:GATA-type domain-containing protein n=1 Tax=Pneumocystis murina (strain B123) TaxID=1069680 RepID=M7NWN9_PNEMU|nr:hypothetical protein PNEG_00136 [Pneumocystis murina B123]EMR11702.1 hypothetical protein PNEG_00136 [Pneumocystis murina B123]
MAKSYFIFLEYPIHMKESDKTLGVDVKFSRENHTSVNKNNVHNPYMDIKGRSSLSSRDNNMYINYDYVSEVKNEEYFDHVLSSASASECSLVDSLATPFLKYSESNSFFVDINQIFRQGEHFFPSNSTFNIADTLDIPGVVNLGEDIYNERSNNDSYGPNKIIVGDSNNLNDVLEISSLDNASTIEKNDSIPPNTRKNVCFNCGVNETPLWRRSPDKKYLLCNACGLYLKQYKYMRPLGFHRKKSSSSQRSSIKLVCVNCEVTETSLWRKNELGKPICNACRLYEKIHNTQRPVTMRKEQVIRRRRYKNLFEHI